MDLLHTTQSVGFVGMQWSGEDVRESGHDGREGQGEECSVTLIYTCLNKTVYTEIITLTTPRSSGLESISDSVPACPERRNNL